MVATTAAIVLSTVRSEEASVEDLVEGTAKTSMGQVNGCPPYTIKEGRKLFNEVGRKLMGDRL